MIIIILITLLIIFLFIMPIVIRIIHNDNRSDVDLYFYHIFNYRLDLDEFIKLFITEKTNRKKIDPKTILNNIEIRLLFIIIFKMWKMNIIWLVNPKEKFVLK